jgi:hypothetical protein
LKVSVEYTATVCVSLLLAEEKQRIFGTRKEILLVKIKNPTPTRAARGQQHLSRPPPAFQQEPQNTDTHTTEDEKLGEGGRKTPTHQTSDKRQAKQTCLTRSKKQQEEQH